MTQWFKNNKAAASWGILAMIAVLTIAAVSGCQLSDIVKFDPPSAVQQAIGVAPRMPMSEAGFTWDEWTAYVERNSKQLAAEIEDGNYRLGMIQSMTDVGMQALQDAAPAFPGGALLVGGLSMMGGLFLKKPGTDKAMAAEKEASYNKGIEEGKRIAIQLYETAKDATT